jgi:hypothetical protein
LLLSAVDITIGAKLWQQFREVRSNLIAPHREGRAEFAKNADAYSIAAATEAIEQCQSSAGNQAAKRMGR